MTAQLQELSTPAQLEMAYQVLKELRTELSFQDFIATYSEARKADGYSMVGAIEDDRPVAVMGYRVLHDFVHGKHLYIDDLVTAATHRSKGIGALLLKRAEADAARLGCRSLRLCTGVANEAGKRFYEREQWQFRSVVYKKKLSLSQQKD